MKEKNNFTRWFFGTVFAILVIITIWDIYIKSYSNVFLNILWIIVLLTIIFFSKKSKIPVWVYFSLFSLVILAILGEFYLYNHFFFFDKFIHFFSQLVVCSLVLYLVRTKIKDKLLLILFCVAIAVTISVIWEITEYSLDNLANGKLQGVYTENNFLWELSEENLVLVQTEIDDTMTDLIANLAGSLFFAGIYFFNKRKVKRKDNKK